MHASLSLDVEPRDVHLAAAVGSVGVVCPQVVECVAECGVLRAHAWGWVVRYTASRGTAASAVLRGGARDLRFTIYD